MNELSFNENELTGARVTVPFTALQRFGPKHHAIVIGQCDNGDVWIAELSRKHGYRLVPLETWLDDNSDCLLYTSPSPRDQRGSRMPSSA